MSPRSAAERGPGTRAAVLNRAYLALQNGIEFGATRPCLDRAEAVAILEALTRPEAAAVVPPGLDVERLARAFGDVPVCIDSMTRQEWCQVHDSPYPEPWLYCRLSFEAFAAEYARLSAGEGGTP